MSVSYQNRVHFWCVRRSEFRVYAGRVRCAFPPEGGTPNIRLREMVQSIVDAGGVWLNARTKCYAQKIHAREIRIDKQGVSFEFELVTICAEISRTHTVARCARRIGENQPGIWIESTGKCLCAQHQEKKKTHVITNNAHVTDVEEEDANSLARAKASGCSVP